MSKEILEIIYWVATLIILGINVYVIRYAPINAVEIGRRLNVAQQKDNAKRNLFQLLFSLRGQPLHQDFVRGLNQIEVVFEDVPLVIEAWRVHLASLGNNNQANATRNWEIERTTLLSAMAVHLGYSSISHSELLRDYYPEGHSNQVLDDLDFREAARSFLKNGDIVYKMMIDNWDSGKRMDAAQEKPPTP
ncbi:MAG: hypothetical protein K2X37_13415 [Chitinophagaceae bacterium]|nr:hypothetical protein [Chitinophagaceae bacterium]